MPAAPSDLPGRLARRTLELVDLPSESRSEQRLAAHVLEVLRPAGRTAAAAGDTCVLAGATERGARPLVLLAGHLDTVPEQGNLPGAIVDGRVVGLGAADMKGARAVMIELAIALAGRETAVDVGFVFFGREELPFAESALTPLLGARAGPRGADLVVVMEPTANALQLGCLGNLNATWTFSGRAGHSARPWLADNAIHRGGRGHRTRSRRCGGVEHRFGGLTYTEVVSVTTIAGGIALNVVPDRAVRAGQLPLPARARRRTRPRRRCAPRASRTGRSRSPGRAVRPGARGEPAGRAAAGGGRRRGRGQAGVDAGRRVRPGRRRRGELRPRGSGARAPRRRAGRGRRARRVPSRCWSGS